MKLRVEQLARLMASEAPSMNFKSGQRIIKHSSIQGISSSKEIQCAG
ncbi:hypothetical protein NC652_017164 [Populus alba x Populus x berolinensis]|nr:hypothetical protein NC652_017164 [Populus alba x Populus x berolinensis]